MKKISYKIATFVFIGSVVTSVFAVDKKLAPQNTTVKKTTAQSMNDTKAPSVKKGTHAVDMMGDKNIKKENSPSAVSNMNKASAAMPHAVDMMADTHLKVGFVDSYQVMGLCKEGEKARVEVESKQQEYAQAIQKEEQKIQQAVAEYKGKATMLSESAREKEEKQLMKMEREYKAGLQDKEEELKLEMQIRTEKLAKNMDAGVKQMAQEQKLDVVFDRATGRAIYVAEAYDMTEQAIKVVDKEYTIKLAQQEKAEKQVTVVAQN